MASDHPQDQAQTQEAVQPAADGRKGNFPPPLSDAKRKRLKQMFEHGNRIAAQDQFDYATDLFTECVNGDPSNLYYVQAFLGNLKKKYNNNKKGAALGFLKTMPLKASLKKAMLKKDWVGAIKTGLEILKINPWDTSALTALSDACDQCGFQESRLAFLRQALDANQKDVELCRRCARTLAELGSYDQAIALWHRVEQLKPNDAEASRAIADLAVRRTIEEGEFDQESGKSKRLIEAAGGTTAGGVVTKKDKLEEEIRRNPQNVALYVELAELHLRNDNYDDAEAVLQAAYERTNDPNVAERLEDVQLRRYRHELAAAENRARANPNDEAAKKQVSEAQRRLWAKELEVYIRRVERYPNNLTFRYELAVRYQLNGKYKEAIREYQQAMGDPRRKGVCLLSLAQCFEKIKQYRLAMSHYEKAIEEISDREGEAKKRALYLAAILAYRMGNLTVAEKYANQLAAMDFSYKGVAQLLDKIAEKMEQQGAAKASEEEPEEVLLPEEEDLPSGQS
ncbi:hypothetical protein JCM19992_16000 [Thermostilla marina]